jgi:hypothetical protein
MSYETGAQKGPGEFHNIYTQPEAFDTYKSTGKFPEKTTFLLVVYEPAQKASINKSGYFEGEMTGLAASVKDSSRFKEGWAYFSFGESGNLSETATALPAPSSAQRTATSNVVSSVAGRAPAPRSRPTRSTGSAPRCVPTRPPPRAPGAGTTPTSSR